MPPNHGLRRGGGRALGWTFLLVCLPILSLHAHAPNTSYLRCVVEPHRLDLTFSFDLATLFRVIGYDINAKGSVSRADMEVASREVYRFLEETVQLQINGQPVSLGKRQPMGWPVDGGSAIEEKDYQQKLLQFHYLLDSKALIEDLTVAYNVFDDLGNDHRVVADFQQSGKRLEVVFTQPEPDYLFDTYWRNEPSVAVPSKDSFAEHFQRGVLKVWTYPALFLVLGALFLPHRGWWLGAGGLSLLGVQIWTMVQSARDDVSPWGVWLGVAVLGLVAAPPAILFQQYRRKRHSGAFKCLPISGETV